MKNIQANELLDTIAKAESNGNYNAYYGRADNTALRFTSMSVGEVLVWQKKYISEGSPSSAVGRYQFIDSTLQSLVNELKIDQQELFNETLQDKLAMALLERRGLRAYVARDISREEFAHNLSKEWAALPQVIGDRPERSFYAGDGLNVARLSIDEIYAGIATIRKI